MILGKRYIRRNIFAGVKGVKCIAVAGTCHGAGTTHLAIAIADFLHSLYGRRTALVELNGSKDFAKIEEALNNHIYLQTDGKDMYRLHGIDYYKNVSRSRFTEIYGDKYEYLVLDIGIDYQKYTEQILMSRVKCLVTSGTPWKAIENNIGRHWFEEMVPDNSVKYYNRPGGISGRSSEIIPDIELFSHSRAAFPFLMSVFMEV